MEPKIVLAQRAFLIEPINRRMVFGQLLEAIVSQAVDTAITDMTDPATAGHEKWPDIYGFVT